MGISTWCSAAQIFTCARDRVGQNKWWNVPGARLCESCNMNITHWRMGHQCISWLSVQCKFLILHITPVKSWVLSLSWSLSSSENAISCPTSLSLKSSTKIMLIIQMVAEKSLAYLLHGASHWFHRSASSVNCLLKLALLCACFLSVSPIPKICQKQLCSTFVAGCLWM